MAEPQVRLLGAPAAAAQEACGAAGRGSVLKGWELSLVLGRSRLLSSGERLVVFLGLALKLSLGGRFMAFIYFWPG